jgi:2,5-diketo-D-gluconate reductase A
MTPGSPPATTSTSGQTLRLNDGHAMPQLGLGVFRVAGDQAAETVRAALDAGYRRFDLAAYYGNEEAIGRALRDSGLPRTELFLTSKLWNDRHGRVQARIAYQESLDRLGVDFLDLYMIHWPAPDRDRFVETWQALVELREAGYVASIATSNFLAEHLDRLLTEVGVVPTVNQIELHPWFQQPELVSYHDDHGIVTEAWSPLGRGAVLEDPTLVRIARRQAASVAQVVLRWHIDAGRGVVPKSVTPSRITTNAQLDHVQLTDGDRAAIGRLDRAERSGPDPQTVS